MTGVVTLVDTWITLSVRRISRLIIKDSSEICSILSNSLPILSIIIYNWTFSGSIDRIQADSARDLDSIRFVNFHEPNLSDFARSFRVIRHFGSHRTNSGKFGVRGLERCNDSISIEFARFRRQSKLVRK